MDEKISTDFATFTINQSGRRGSGMARLRPSRGTWRRKVQAGVFLLRFG